MNRPVSFVFIIAMCFTLNVNGHSIDKSKHQYDLSIDFSASENLSITSGSHGLFNNAADKETGQRLIQPLYPTIQKSPYGNLPKDGYAEITRKNETASYIYNSECLIVRFERFDIIHPFNYFW